MLRKMVDQQHAVSVRHQCVSRINEIRRLNDRDWRVLHSAL